MKANDLKNAVLALIEGQKALSQSNNAILTYLNAMEAKPAAVAPAAVAPAAVAPAAVAPAAVALTPAQKAKATRDAKKQAAKALSVDPIAPSQLTFKLWIANKAANKIDPKIEVVKDYHKRGLTVSQVQTLLDGFNAITGYKA